jgi:methylmalonyl-CoA/ethylmalonyl-CoA epimerase
LRGLCVDRGMAKVTKLDHVAVVVSDLDDAIERYRTLLGVEGQGREVVESQQTEAVLFPVGESNVELISPRGNAGLERFLERQGPGLHHIAIEVEGLEARLAELKEAGVRLIDESPRVGARGHRVAFVHPKASGGVLIELVEPAE